MKSEFIYVIINRKFRCVYTNILLYEQGRILIFEDPEPIPCGDFPSFQKNKNKKIYFKNDTIIN